MEYSRLPHDVQMKIIGYLIPSWTISKELKQDIIEYPLMNAFRNIIAMTGCRNASFGILYNIINGKFNSYVYFRYSSYEQQTIDLWKSLTNDERDLIKEKYLDDIFYTIKEVFMEDLCKFHVEYRI